jgi:hypothetical protein
MGQEDRFFCQGGGFSIRLLMDIYGFYPVTADPTQKEHAQNVVMQVMNLGVHRRWRSKRPTAPVSLCSGQWSLGFENTIYGDQQ